eukprot:scaffold6019_cov84-Isochrysis_galbana.AAC.2
MSGRPRTTRLGGQGQWINRRRLLVQPARPSAWPTLAAAAISFDSLATTTSISAARRPADSAASRTVASALRAVTRASSSASHSVLATAWAALAAWIAEDARASAAERAASTSARACAGRVGLSSKGGKWARAVGVGSPTLVYHGRHRAEVRLPGRRAKRMRGLQDEGAAQGAQQEGCREGLCTPRPCAAAANPSHLRLNCGGLLPRLAQLALQPRRLPPRPRLLLRPLGCRTRLQPLPCRPLLLLPLGRRLGQPHLSPDPLPSHRLLRLFLCGRPRPHRLPLSQAILGGQLPAHLCPELLLQPSKLLPVPGHQPLNVGLEAPHGSLLDLLRLVHHPLGRRSAAEPDTVRHAKVEVRTLSEGWRWPPSQTDGLLIVWDGRGVKWVSGSGA